MKKGKTINLKLFNNLKTTYGTVDSKVLKSIYIKIQTWVEPKYYQDNWFRVVNSIRRNVKLCINDNVDNRLFNNNSIVDLDLRSSGIFVGKKSFMNLEITLFVLKDMDFKSIELKTSITDLIKKINKTVLSNNKYFNFSLNKIGNLKKVY